MTQTDTLSSVLQDSVSAGNPALELGSLYEPPPVAFSFETIGWPILAGVLLIVLIIGVFILIRKYIKNRYRREALQALENMNDAGAIAKIFVVLKQVAMKAFGRESVGNLYGKEWLQFLEKTGKGVKMLPYESQIMQAVYKDEALQPESGNEILLNAKKWVKTHGHSGQL
jgi:hypothetical protein